MNTEHAAVKMKLSKPPPGGFGNYQYLQETRNLERMSSFKIFLRWYNNKDIVPFLEAMQKLNAYYHEKDIDML